MKVTCYFFTCSENRICFSLKGIQFENVRDSYNGINLQQGVCFVDFGRKFQNIANYKAECVRQNCSLFKEKKDAFPSSTIIRGGRTSREMCWLSFKIGRTVVYQTHGQNVLSFVAIAKRLPFSPSHSPIIQTQTRLLTEYTDCVTTKYFPFLFRSTIRFYNEIRTSPKRITLFRTSKTNSTR